MHEQKHETRAKKAKMAISYITCGTLMVVWSVVWLTYLLSDADVSGYVYLAVGAVLSGLAVAAIGFSVGRVGKEANVDEEEHDDEVPDVRTPPATDIETVTKKNPPASERPDVDSPELHASRHNAGVS